MSMPIEKAKVILQKYREANYNATEALPKVGYTNTVATKQSKRVINTAIKTVVKSDINEIVNSSNPMSKLLGFVGLSQDELANEYLSLIKQNKDLSTKLKAMLPLLAEHGIKWDNEKTDVQVPILNVTVKDNKSSIIEDNQGGGVVGNEKDKS